MSSRFVAYDDLRRAYLADAKETAASAGTERLTLVRQALRRILLQNPDGIKGALLMPALRREISPTFDVSEFGYKKLSQLLHALPDLVKVQPGQGGDILVALGTMTSAASTSAALPLPAVPHERIGVAIGDSLVKLKEYRYESEPAERRRILLEVHRAMLVRPLFTWTEVAARVAEETHDSKLSVSLLSKYFSVLWQARAFAWEPNQFERPTKDREMRLNNGLAEFARFVALYERSILIKVKQAGSALDGIGAAMLLGLDRDCPSVLRYVQTLLESEPSEPLPAMPPVAGPGGEPSPELVSMLTTIFVDKGSRLSKGQIVNELRRIHADQRQIIRTSDSEAMLSACVDFGVLTREYDGVTRVYRLHAPSSDPADRNTDACATAVGAERSPA